MDCQQLGTTAAFLDKGFGFATVHGNEVVSWSLADCVSGAACEIGHTAEAHRRRGLAAATAAAAVEHALSNGFTTVGWHTSKDNVGRSARQSALGLRESATTPCTSLSSTRLDTDPQRLSMPA
ncbi:MAG: GNAT family N-acetyltransferase [Anaerolineae bacterium]|nr:GNAT family N-acetyltransferase [Anaerolineae bacterium]